MTKIQEKKYATPICDSCREPMAAAKHQDTAHWVCPNPDCPNPTIRPFSESHPGRSSHNILANPPHYNDVVSVRLRKGFADENTVCQTLYTLTSGSPPNLSDDLKANLLTLH